MNGGFLFLGLFLGILFLMITVLIIYYKQVSEGYEDAKRFGIMQKVGMSDGEIRRTKIQIEQNRVMSFFSERLIDHGACDERHITLRTDTACQNYYFHIL